MKVSANEMRKAAKEVKSAKIADMLKYAANVVETCYKEWFIYHMGKEACSQNEQWCESHIDLIERILGGEMFICPHCEGELIMSCSNNRLICPCGYESEEFDAFTSFLKKTNEYIRSSIYEDN